MVVVMVNRECVRHGTGGFIYAVSSHTIEADILSFLDQETETQSPSSFSRDTQVTKLVGTRATWNFKPGLQVVLLCRVLKLTYQSMQGFLLEGGLIFSLDGAFEGSAPSSSWLYHSLASQWPLHSVCNLWPRDKHQFSYLALMGTSHMLT